MITQEQINNLRAGDKLVFYRYGGTLHAMSGNVFTFANWYHESDDTHPGKRRFQCQELHEAGNHEHNFLISDTELFDETKHTFHVLMTKEAVSNETRRFIHDFGE